jgi:hypothetical protein
VTALDRIEDRLRVTANELQLVSDLIATMTINVRDARNELNARREGKRKRGTKAGGKR